jgi:hypothetical protein
MGARSVPQVKFVEVLTAPIGPCAQGNRILDVLAGYELAILLNWESSEMIDEKWCKRPAFRAVAILCMPPSLDSRPGDVVLGIWPQRREVF